MPIGIRRVAAALPPWPAPCSNVTMDTHKPLCLLILFAATSLPGVARADVKPNSLFSDNAVLQRDVAVPVWGTARDGEKVTVEIAGQTVSTTARNGRWMVRLRPLKAGGGPLTMVITGDNTQLNWPTTLFVEPNSVGCVGSETSIPMKPGS